jgi:hypothetical protein
MKLTLEQIVALRNGTEGVTPGPWALNRKASMVGITNEHGYSRHMFESQWPNDPQGQQDTAHIARCDPDTISALATEVLESRATIERLERQTGEAITMAMHVEAKLRLESRAEIERLTKERDEARAEYRRYGELRALLSDPNAVHVNMLRGEIAKPSWEQMKHLRPEESAAELEDSLDALRKVATAQDEMIWFLVSQCDKLVDSQGS